MALPTLTPEQRKAALDIAVESRTARANLKKRITAGEETALNALARTEPWARKMRVTELLTSIKGIGPMRAESILTKLNIPPRRRIQGLGARQLAALTDTIANLTK